MSDRIEGVKAEFTPQLDEIKAMARQDVAVARERLAGEECVRDFLVREPVKALGIAPRRRSHPGMADQASLNGCGTARVPGSGSGEFEGVAEFVDDLASLSELQAKLAAADFRDAARWSADPIVLTVVGLAGVVAGVRVALLGAGWLLASALNIH